MIIEQFKQYSNVHLEYANVIQKRNKSNQIDDQTYLKLRGKLTEWLNYSIERSKLEKI